MWQHVFSFPWIRDAALWAEYEEHCEQSILRGIKFAILCGVCLPLRCSWEYLPVFNPLWFTSLGFMVMGICGTLLHCTILWLKWHKNNGSTEYTWLLDRILSCKGNQVNFPDVIAVAGTFSWCFMLLGRVANPCPPDIDYWRSQYCNPHPDSIPTDNVAALFIIQLCVMVFLRGTTIQVIMLCYVAAIVVLSIALAQVGDTLQAFTVVLALFAMLTAFETERIFREEFFNRRARNELLHQIFPASIVPMLVNGQEVKPTEHDNVCVFFSDIVSYTELTHYLGPLGTLTLMNEINSITDKCVLHFYPKVSKTDTIGDGYLCECGVVWSGGSLGENCAAILKFALMVQAQMASIVNPLTGRPLELRIGVHCGSCAAGLVGNQKLLPHFSLFGDLINTAARIETTSSPGMIHVSDATVQSVMKWQAEDKDKDTGVGGGDDEACCTGEDNSRRRHDLTFAYRGVVDLKGLGPMRTWWLLGTKDAVFNGSDSDDKAKAKARTAAPTRQGRVEAPSGVSMLDYTFDVRSVAPDAATLEPVILELFNLLFDLQSAIRPEQNHGQPHHPQEFHSPDRIHVHPDHSLPQLPPRLRRAPVHRGSLPPQHHAVPCAWRQAVPGPDHVRFDDRSLVPRCGTRWTQQHAPRQLG
jgi:class 3 adenylate cyclase